MTMSSYIRILNRLNQPDSEDTDIENLKSEMETLVDKAEQIEAAIESDIEDKTVEIESVLKHQLSNIEHFVRDDFKAQYKKEMEEELEVLGEFEEKMQNSGVERSAHVSVISAICILLSRTLLQNML